MKMLKETFIVMVEAGCKYVSERLEEKVKRIKKRGKK